MSAKKEVTESVTAVSEGESSSIAVEKKSNDIENKIADCDSDEDKISAQFADTYTSDTPPDSESSAIVVDIIYDIEDAVVVVDGKPETTDMSSNEIDYFKKPATLDIFRFFQFH